MWAVVGLGNPGRRYANTRHNVGFMFVRRVAKDWKVRLRKRAFQSKTGLKDSGREGVWLVLPQTYMNQSGQAVRGLLKGRGIKPERLVVVYDDLDIPLGEIRIRKEGGSGTHKGMISVIDEIQMTRFPRIRIGIGPLVPEGDAVEFVLSPFRQEEKPLLELSLEAAQEALSLILDGETEKAMNLYNKRSTGQGTRSEESALE